MKNIILISLFFHSLVAQCDTSAYVCSAQCLDIQTNHRLIFFKGEKLTAAKTRVKAWKKILTACENQSQNALLVKNIQWIKLNSNAQIQMSSLDSFHFYHWLHYTKYSSYQNNDFELKLDLMSMNDCSLEQVPEEMLEDYYQGNLPLKG